MARPFASKCQHFKGMLIAHGVAETIGVHHVGYAVSRWFEAASGMAKFSVPDKTWSSYFHGVSPSHYWLQQVRRLCPSAGYWIDHPLCQVLNPLPRSRDYWLSLLMRCCAAHSYRFETLHQVLPHLTHAADDIDLAIVLMVLRTTASEYDPLNMRCCRYLPTVMALACRKAPLMQVKYQLFELINETFGLSRFSTHSVDGWPENVDQLDCVIESWELLISLAKEVNLVSTNEDASRFCKLLGDYSEIDMLDFIMSLITASRDAVPIFRYKVLRRMYNALRRARLAAANYQQRLIRSPKL